MDDDGNEAPPPSEGFLTRFAPVFIAEFGHESLFVRTLSDLWTIAYARLRIANDLPMDSAPVAQFADGDAMTVLGALLTSHEALREPLFREPLGIAPRGTIRREFDALFGSGSLAEWVAAFNTRDFGRCREVVETAPYRTGGES